MQADVLRAIRSAASRCQGGGGVAAGVRPDISERVLSHVIPGVEGIYDCYEYLVEKHDALTKVAAANAP